QNADIANFNKINFPVTLHDIDKFEEINLNYAINIFRPVYKEVFRKIKVDIDPLHISERNYQVEHMIDLLYLTEGEENLNDRKNPNDIPEGLRTHYVLITDFTRLMHLLEKHIPTCPGPSKAPQHLIFPEEGKNYVKPKYIKNMVIKPYIIDMDLEAEEIEVEEKDKEGNTIKIAEQKAVSYGYTIHCSDRTTQKPVIYRESENIIKDLMENLQEDLDIILDKFRIPVPYKLYEAGYNKICIFDPETKKYLGASHRKCHRKKPMIQGKNKVLDHDHITGKFRGASHSSCNLKLRIDPKTIKIPVLISNGSGYNFHHLMQEIAKVTDEKIVPIANNSEQYITFSVGQLQFIDSIKFLLPGLAKMAKNLRDEKRGVFPYQWLNSKEKFKETQLPPRKEFNSDLDGFNYCDHNCRIEKCEHRKKIEVKLTIPKELYPKFRDYPMCPERKKQCIREEYVLEKVYRILEFDQSPWLEPYIAMNTQRRAKAKNAFEKDFWKLMNNSVFGKTMEDVRKRVNIDLVRQVGEEHRLRRLISDSAF
ncbi:2899_t:CDS:2, partial [Gigaspora rosea]